MESFKVSIITPLHNASLFITETIRSVLSQSYENWELIIVDDCSDDNSLEIVQNIAIHDHRIKVVKLKKKSGAAVARNTAIERATGRYIAFLDSDDLWVPTKLEEQITFMNKNNFVFTFTSYNKINEKGEKIGYINVPEKVNYFDLLKTCSIGCLTAIYDTKILGKVYMPLIKKRQDYGLWLKILKKTPFAHGINKPLGNYRVRNNSLSGNKFIAAKYQWKVYREIEKLSLFNSINYVVSYTISGLYKTYFK